MVALWAASQAGWGAPPPRAVGRHGVEWGPGFTEHPGPVGLQARQAGRHPQLKGLIGEMRLLLLNPFQGQSKPDSGSFCMNNTKLTSGQPFNLRVIPSLGQFHWEATCPNSNSYPNCPHAPLQGSPLTLAHVSPVPTWRSQKLPGIRSVASSPAPHQPLTN